LFGDRIPTISIGDFKGVFDILIVECVVVPLSFVVLVEKPDFGDALLFVGVPSAVLNKSSLVDSLIARDPGVPGGSVIVASSLRFAVDR